MPTSATHITVVERVAASNPAMKQLLGDPFADADSTEGTRMRFAKLGSLGPDFFYAMADYGGDLQDLENFLIKVAGSFASIGELMGEVGRYVNGVESVITFGISDSLRQTFELVTGVFNEGLLALLVGPAGLNFWPIFEAARQKDVAREGWFWADYLHYVKTGDFVTQLIMNAKGSRNPNLIAYAYGYLTHYVTDVVGHPYVNQVVQGPWRLYWQRHHTVENFMDAYVWDRWHNSNPPPPAPSTEEQPLDTLVTVPNATGSGAPVTFARLNDHVNIGSISLGDPVDKLVQAVADKIKDGLFEIGVAEAIEPEAPTEADFLAWTELMAKTIKEVYDRNAGHRIAENLKNPPSRPTGYPTADDIGAAYGVFRLVLRMATEEKIQEPQPPDVLGDISDALQQLLDDLQNDLNSFPPLPTINTSGSFSWSSLWDAIKKIAEWIGETAAAIGRTAFDFIKNLINTVGTAVSEPIKYALYLINKALFALYSAFRDVLVYAGYSIPYTDRLSVDIGGGNSAETLWRSAGNFREQYPVEEIGKERDKFFSTYSPIVPPLQQPESQNLGTVFSERPSFSFVAPYQPSFGSTLTPDAFIDAPLGPDDMFAKTGPQVASPSGKPTIDVTFKNFGGAIANSLTGISLSEADFPNNSLLPNYNLDGDRSYAWPCWDITDPVPVGSPPTTTKTPLKPELTVNDTSTREALAEVTIVAA